MNEELLDKVSKKSKVKKEIIIDLARKLSNENMTDENVLSDVIIKLEDATGKKVSDKTKEKIIKTIKENKVPKNIDKMF